MLFYHCFTRLLMDGRWVSIDPTLDRTNCDTFFQPAGVTWSIDWDRRSDILLTWRHTVDYKLSGCVRRHAIASIHECLVLKPEFVSKKISFELHSS